MDLKRWFGYPQGRAPETMFAARTKTEPLVVRGRSFEEHQRHSSAIELLEPLPNERTPDTVPLAFRQHTDRAEYLDVDEPLRGVEQVAGK
jgi:hypothetical protein